MGKVFFYLDDYSEEFLPLGLEGPTLQGWADWLALGGPGFDPVEDGTEYAASRLTLRDPIKVIRRLRPEEEEDNDDWEELVFEGGKPKGIDFAAFTDCFSWTEDDFLDPDDLEDGLCDDDRIEPGEVGSILVGTSENIRLVYRADPPRLEEVSKQ